jgi:DNA repair protein RadC
MNNLDKVSDVELASAFKERFRIKNGTHIKSSQDAVNHLATYLGGKLTREAFFVVFLSGKNEVIATEKLFEGTLTSSAVYPRIIIQKIIEHGAAALILAHNHPSSNKSPSSDDRTITNKIVTACSTIDVSVLDHLILIPGGDFISFADKGLI